MLGGTARGAYPFTRLRLLVVLAVGILGLSVAGRAPASRIQVKGAAPNGFEYTGHDWVGKVSLFYTYDAGGGSFSSFKLANLCSRRGSALSPYVSVIVGRNKRFHYRGHGFTISGNVIGRLGHPREIAGLASVSTHGCASGPWWFGVKPAGG